MFQITQEILEKTEAYLLGVSDKNRILGTLNRYLIFPIKYLCLGLKDFFKPASLWVILSVVLLVLSMYFIQGLELDLDPKYSLLILNVCIYFPLILVVFAVPSTYSYYGVEASYVKKISDFIKTAGLDTIEKIELLEKNIENINKRIFSRVLFYRWGIGIVWALSVLFFNIEVKYITAENKVNMNYLLMENISSLAIILVSTLLALTLLIGYQRASEVLIKSIEFSCTESKYALLKKNA